jgi:N-acetylglucosaminyl-diphospho-decaprenol L-rhamnosyltransferase
VRSLRRRLPPARIVVVLNDPDEVEPQAREALAADAEIVSPPSPQGYGANLNLGVRALGDRVEYCLLSNDDIVFEAGCLERLVETMTHDESIGVVGPAIHRADTGRLEQPFVPFPSLAAEFRSLGPRPPLSRPDPHRGDEPRRSSSEENEAGWIHGAAMLARMSAFDAVNGFDEDFFLYFEEVDLCYRLRKAGWRIAWCRDAEVVHQQGASIEPASGLAMASKRLYFEKRLGRARWAVAELLLVTTFCVSAAYNCVAAALQPSTARRRISRFQNLWENRVFLRGSARS